jgi:hypothetical protein
LTLKIVQWTTGNVGRQVVRQIDQRTDMELVGLFAYSPDKVGLDAGELAGMDRKLGVLATNDITAIIGLRPDCVSYFPLVADLDEMSRLLRAGINIVTTSEFITGRAFDAAQVEELRKAAIEGQASVFGSGINPGFVEYLLAAASSPCSEVSLVRVIESYDLSMMAFEANQDDLGWGRPKGDPTHASDLRAAIFEFEDALDLVAQLFKVPLDDYRYDVNFAHATRRVEVEGRDVPAGSVAGIEVTWTGVTGGRDFVELVARWCLTVDLDVPMEVLHGYHLQVVGNPSIDVRLNVTPTQGESTVQDLLDMGRRITGQPALNAIPAVVAAAPGIVTYADLPPITGPIRH